LATREGDSDDGSWQWGGALVTHELNQQVDGTLGVRIPQPVRDQFSRAVPSSIEPVSGAWEMDGLTATVNAQGVYAAALGPELMGPSLITVDIAFTSETRSCGLLITNGGDPDCAYYLRLEPDARRLVFDRWPRRRSGSLQWQIGGEIAHLVELERHIDLEPARPHRLEVIVDGSACIAYLDGQIALSTRIYGQGERRCGWFVSEGAGTFSAISVRSLPEETP
jgi:beta-fructofuranosidase